jgi:hypothetical protein
MVWTDDERVIEGHLHGGHSCGRIRGIRGKIVLGDVASAGAAQGRNEGHASGYDDISKKVCQF